MQKTSHGYSVSLLLGAVLTGNQRTGSLDSELFTPRNKKKKKKEGISTKHSKPTQHQLHHDLHVHCGPYGCQGQYPNLENRRCVPGQAWTERAHQAPAAEPGWSSRAVCDEEL